MKIPGALRRHARAWVALTLWLALAGTTWWLARDASGGVTGWLERTFARAIEQGWAYAAVAAAYALRPLLLLPVTVLTVFVGFWLGPWWGALVATVGATLSSLPPFFAARRLGPEAAPDGRLGGLVEGVRDHAFVAVLSARLAYLPGDLVNIAAGAWRAPLWAFVAATALGGAPGLTMAVLAGAGLRGRGEGFRFEGLELRPSLLIASGVLLLLSLATAFALRRFGFVDQDEAEA